MKTQDSVKTPSVPSLSKVLKTCCLLMLMGSLTSCSKSSKSSSVAFQPDHWHKVSNSPPTYYPKGVPANYPTTADNGQWIFTGDSAKTSYFVPLNNVATKSLVAEATTQKDPDDGQDFDGKGTANDIAKGGIYGFFYLMMEITNMQARNGVAPPNGLVGNEIRRYEESQ